MNKWIEANNIRKIQNVHEFYGQSPVGMSGHQENVIFISLWYESEAAKEVAIGHASTAETTAAG